MTAMMAMLNRLLPSAFPRAILGTPIVAPVTVVVYSGIDVIVARKRRPIQPCPILLRSPIASPNEASLIPARTIAVEVRRNVIQCIVIRLFDSSKELVV
jgi:hypothetical protein